MSFPSLRFQQSEVYEIPLTLPSLPISKIEMGREIKDIFFLFSNNFSYLRRGEVNINQQKGLRIKVLKQQQDHKLLKIP